MRPFGLSVSISGFLVLGLSASLYLFSSIGELSLYNNWGYTVYAGFETAAGLTPGAPVEIAGVRVGRVDSIDLEGKRARVTLTIRDNVEIQEDAIASIQTKGLLGGPYLFISLGGSEQLVGPEGTLRETISPIDLPGLMSAFIENRKNSSALMAE